MSVVETVGMFVGVPLVVVLVLAAAVFGRSLTSTPTRYRPGKPWPYHPVWYLPNTPGVEHPSEDQHRALTGSTRAALDRGADPLGPRRPEGSTSAVGGAVGEW